MNVWGDRAFRYSLYVFAGVTVLGILIVGLAAHTPGMIPVLMFGVLWYARDMLSFDDELAVWLAWESA